MSVSGETITNSVLSGIAAAPINTKIAKWVLTYNGDNSINTMQFYDVNNNLLFTLTFDYSSGSVVSITRT